MTGIKKTWKQGFGLLLILITLGCILLYFYQALF